MMGVLAKIFRSSDLASRTAFMDSNSGVVGIRMVYVQRDECGHLIRVEMAEFEGMTGYLPADSEELLSWLKAREEIKARLDALNASDLDLIRVLEDVVCVLVERGVIQYTDLPEAARQKLDQRALVRADLEGIGDTPV